MSAEGSSTLALLQHHLTLAADLCARCHAYSSVKGYNKLLKKCQAELKFLEGLRSRKPHELKECHLRSSNLASLEGIVVAMETLPHVTSMLQPFSWSNSPHPVVVDLVCNHGYTWVKVVARKAQALHLVWAGGGQFGERNVSDQADELLLCAAAHPIQFQVPQVLLVFTGGVTAPLRDALSARGIHVQGQLVPVDDITQQKLLMCDDDSDDSQASGTDDDNDIKNALTGAEADGLLAKPDVPTSTKQEVTSAEPEVMSFEPEVTPTPPEMDQSGFALTPSDPGSTPLPTAEVLALAAVGSAAAVSGSGMAGLLTTRPQVTKVNLDITALIALVSNQCHGRAHYVFREEVLTRQATQERRQALLPLLRAFIEGKEVFACETAVADFQTILGTVGGAEEKARAARLLSSVCVVPDHPSPRAQALVESAKVKDRAKVIFGTGDRLEAITVTANVGFVRAAKNQGISFAVYLHEPRALTEQKEETATPLDKSSSQEEDLGGSNSGGKSSTENKSSLAGSSLAESSLAESSLAGSSLAESSLAGSSLAESSLAESSSALNSTAGSSVVGDSSMRSSSEARPKSELSSSEQFLQPNCSVPQGALALSS